MSVRYNSHILPRQRLTPILAHKTVELLDPPLVAFGAIHPRLKPIAAVRCHVFKQQVLFFICHAAISLFDFLFNPNYEY